MKYLVLLMLMFLVGCSSTFKDRLVVYKKALAIAKEVGPMGAKIYVDKKYASGDITEEEKETYYEEIDLIKKVVE